VRLASRVRLTATKALHCLNVSASKISWCWLVANDVCTEFHHAWDVSRGTIRRRCSGQLSSMTKRVFAQVSVQLVAPVGSAGWSMIGRVTRTERLSRAAPAPFGQQPTSQTTGRRASTAPRQGLLCLTLPRPAGSFLQGGIRQNMSRAEPVPPGNRILGATLPAHPMRRRIAPTIAVLPSLVL